ncbi:DNA methyltransferase [Staphylococcus aureus]|nr:DNA methyltransferase [Staphylococcus aureus]WEK87822.1 DNA methyltransferase [Staphylococcus aureus]WLW33972.1 Type III restriction-modification system methylation subunit [Staphylococcus aureus]
MKDNVNELLIERLKEKGLNPEDFKDVLDAIKQPKYGLIWEDHPEHIEERMKYNRPVLREEKELRIDSGYGHTNNILMEGDNLASLIAMREDGKKVDVIYIDPPYNTGNEFVYNDKIVDKEDSFRHSKWLSFMEKRLKVARDLMTDAGVIFVSIDDNEQANLKLLMDEVFGEENDLGTITVVNNMKGRSDSKFFATSSEFMQVYAKQSS